ncbi:MAG: hypothetical protein MZW92_01680 [Comamonadaceae bacterium]|nr:hypothetical protein [Comamonadaceae bacterium]
MPVGKTLFFPLINLECSTLEAPPFFGEDETALRACAKSFGFSDVYATVDGVPVQDVGRYLVESPLFTFTLPDNNVLGLEGGQTGQSVSYGYFLMIPPCHLESTRSSSAAPLPISHSHWALPTTSPLFPRGGRLRCRLLDSGQPRLAGRG